jgi:hypothetical protein
MAGAAPASIGSAQHAARQLLGDVASGGVWRGKIWANVERWQYWFTYGVLIPISSPTPSQTAVAPEGAAVFL